MATTNKSETAPCCLTVAGSDSGGNAGVQADLRAFHAYGVHGCTVLAALTAQNPSGVAAAMPVPAGFVAAQLDAVLGVYSVRAMKTGMLSDPATVDVVADRFAAHPEIAKVIDPVMVATSGARLVSEEAVRAIRARLLPLATLVTPNLPEAEALCGLGPGARDAARAEELARRIHGEFGCAVLVKGGHGDGAAAVDVLFDGRDALAFSLPRAQSPVSTHGTGCSLAAAIAAELALGRGLAAAVGGAKRYVRDAIENARLVGPGCGVLGFVEGAANAIPVAPSAAGGGRLPVVAVVGLGLIGGSFLKAARRAGYETVALHHGESEGLERADVVLVCLPPEAIVPWVSEHAAQFGRGTTVVDICGVKTAICREMAKMPKPGGWRFVGGHPMAGKEVSGYANSTADLFVGRSMVLCPESGDADMAALERLFRSLGFARVVVATPERHDEMIAFTSQLGHVVASAYVQDPRMAESVGFSAGSFANMSRIASVDAETWASLYLADREALLGALDGFVGRLGAFRRALEARDEAGLRAFVAAGAAAKRAELARATDSITIVAD